MLKFLLIIFLFFFILFRLGGFLLKMLGGPSRQDRAKGRKGRKYTPPGGNVSVDYEPKNEKKKKDFEGGEYVDYEDVK
jgi:hypothetical protein